MAAYAATVTSAQPKAAAIGQQKLGVFAGSVNITNYNQTNAAITAITGKFRTVIAVVAGITDEGYFLEWNAANTSFKAWKATGNAGAAEEVASDVDVGLAKFTAYGII